MRCSFLQVFNALLQRRRAGAYSARAGQKAWWLETVFAVGPGPAALSTSHSENIMSANPQFMEHRWGTRVDLEASARLMTGDGMCEAVLRNASLSGAFLETTARPTLLSRVSVRPVSPGGEWLDGWVVRIEPRGIAVEWLDPPLHSVAVLLALHGPRVMASPRGPRVQPVVPLRPRTLAAGARSN